MGESTPIEIAKAAREIVTDRLAKARFKPPPGFLDRIETFAAALALWGARLNLTSAPDEPAEIAFHIMDSLAPLLLAHRGETTTRADSHSALTHQIEDALPPDSVQKDQKEADLVPLPTSASDSDAQETRNPENSILTTAAPTTMTPSGHGKSTGMAAACGDLPDAFVAGSNRTIVERSDLTDAFLAGSRVLDLGSGAGYPALILAAACDAGFHLLEARRKRASFLRVTAAEMGLSNVQVDSSRFEPVALRRARVEPPPAQAQTLRRDGDESSLADAATLKKIQVGSTGAGTEPSPRVRVGSSRADGLTSQGHHEDSFRDKANASRGVFDVVTARAFAEPAIVFETAAEALKQGGMLILYARTAQRTAIEQASASMFEPPVFLLYDIAHAATGTVAESSSDEVASSMTGVTHAASGAIAGGSSGSVTQAATEDVNRGSTGGRAGSAHGEVVRNTSGVARMLAVCRRR